MGLNSGAVIPSMDWKLQIGQILRRLQNFVKTSKLLKCKRFMLAQKRYKILTFSTLMKRSWNFKSYLYNVHSWCYWQFAKFQSWNQSFAFSSAVFTIQALEYLPSIFHRLLCFSLDTCTGIQLHWQIELLLHIQM